MLLISFASCQMEFGLHVNEVNNVKCLLYNGLLYIYCTSSRVLASSGSFSCSAIQGILRLLWNSKLHYCVHKEAAYGTHPEPDGSQFEVLCSGEEILAAVQLPNWRPILSYSIYVYIYLQICSTFGICIHLSPVPKDVPCRGPT
jgi:hypothetical protein